MAIQDRLFALASKIISVISLRNIGIWASAALVALLAYTAFQNRKILITLIIRDEPEVTAPVTNIAFIVSDTSRAKIKQIVDANDFINSIAVMNVDLRNNRRIPVYWYSDDSSIQRVLDGLFMNESFSLFTSDEKNNETIVGTLNGEFMCRSYEESGSAGILPGLGPRVPFVCRASLPPYYGQFSGFLLITLNQQPAPVDIDAVQTSVYALSTEIFFRDVNPNPVARR